MNLTRDTSLIDHLADRLRAKLYHLATDNVPLDRLIEAHSCYLINYQQGDERFAFINQLRSREMLFDREMRVSRERERESFGLALVIIYV